MGCAANVCAYRLTGLTTLPYITVIGDALRHARPMLLLFIQVLRSGCQAGVRGVGLGDSVSSLIEDDVKAIIQSCKGFDERHVVSRGACPPCVV